MCHSRSMMTGSQILQDRVSAGATARLDRGFTEPESAERNLENWLHQVAGEFASPSAGESPSVLKMRRGFTWGCNRLAKRSHMDWERAGILADDEHF